MNPHIELYQHFYSRAPFGLDGRTDGLRVIACSNAVRDLTWFIEGLQYKTMTQSSGPHPVAWRFLRAPDDAADKLNVCITRVCETGCDDGVKRPGNVLAHSFITDSRALKLIDYDVPALIDSIEAISQPRFTNSSGTTSGFADWQSAISKWKEEGNNSWGEVPSIRIPVADVQERRQNSLDPKLESVRKRLEESSGAAAITSLLSACCDSEYAQVTLQYNPDGHEMSDFCSSVLALIFGYLPFCVRKTLRRCNKITCPTT